MSRPPQPVRGIDAWVRQKPRGGDPRHFFRKETPPARSRPGTEYTLSLLNPGRGYHVGRKRGQSDPVTHISAKELRQIDREMTEATALEAARRLNDSLPRYHVTTPPQVAAYVAQAMAESDAFTDYEEDLAPYRPGRLQEVFGRRRFPTLESEVPYRNDPERFANYVYGSRNGNNQPGDGYRYRGRGPMMLTGREAYRLAGRENDPDSLVDPAVGFEASARWWDARGLPRRTRDWLPDEAFDGVTLSVNGPGMEKAAERREMYRRAQQAMAWRDR